MSTSTSTSSVSHVYTWPNLFRTHDSSSPIQAPLTFCGFLCPHSIRFVTKPKRTPFKIYISSTSLKQGIGEPSLILGTSVFLAIKGAISAAREESGHSKDFRLDSPATSERIRLACQDKFTQMVCYGFFLTKSKVICHLSILLVCQSLLVLQRNLRIYGTLFMFSKRQCNLFTVPIRAPYNPVYVLHLKMPKLTRYINQIFRFSCS